MKNHLDVTRERDFIKIVASGEQDLEFATRIWSATAKLCEEHDCFKVLGVSTTTVALPAFDGYEHVQLFQSLGITPAKYRIAWVEVMPVGHEAIEFVESVLRNRGFRVRLFSDVSEAQGWLLDEGAT